MLFTEFRFLVFFVLAFGVHWALRPATARKAWLLGCSYLFYAAWDWRFLALIWISTAVDYVAGLGIHRATRPSKRKRWLLLSLLTNLGLLGFFKYWNFFLDSAAGLLGWLGLEPNLPVLEVILPVGISFFTFQTMSYSLDIYFRRLEPTRRLLDLALFVGFFPQLVAGPIVRAVEFLPQLRAPRRWSDVAARTALLLFLSGFIKKACISDQIAPLVDGYFADPGGWTAASAWLATLLYAVQIYCDFSGYSDMAIACAALLGYRLPVNFRFPYLAANLTDFWRRWHISLSSWLRDYLYIPLGGNRGGVVATHRNLMLTMLLGGLWHGAAWNFVIWGGLHGAGLVLHRMWKALMPEESGLRRAAAPLGPLVTLFWVLLCWIFFRAADLGSAFTTARAFLLFQSVGTQAFDPMLWWILPPLIAAHFLAWRNPVPALGERLPQPVFAAGLGAAFALAVAFTTADYQPFIYFQF